MDILIAVVVAAAVVYFAYTIFGKAKSDPVLDVSAPVVEESVQAAPVVAVASVAEVAVVVAPVKKSAKKAKAKATKAKTVKKPKLHVAK